MGNYVSKKISPPTGYFYKLPLSHINITSLQPTIFSAKVKICKFSENPILVMANTHFMSKPDLRKTSITEEQEPTQINKCELNMFQKSFQKTQMFEYKKTCILDEEDEYIVSIGILRDEDL